MSTSRQVPARLSGWVTLGQALHEVAPGQAKLSTLRVALLTTDGGEIALTTRSPLWPKLAELAGENWIRTPMLLTLDERGAVTDLTPLPEVVEAPHPARIVRWSPDEGLAGVGWANLPAAVKLLAQESWVSVRGDWVPLLDVLRRGCRV